MRKSLGPIVTSALLLLSPVAWSQSDRTGSIAGERDADTGLTDVDCTLQVDGTDSKEPHSGIVRMVYLGDGGRNVETLASTFTLTPTERVAVDTQAGLPSAGTLSVLAKMKGNSIIISGRLEAATIEDADDRGVCSVRVDQGAPFVASNPNQIHALQLEFRLLFDSDLASN